MKLYLLTRTDKHDYYEYDSVVVCATSSRKARKIPPLPSGRGWVTNTDKLEVKLLGNAHRSIKEGVVLGSFNAG